MVSQKIFFCRALTHVPEGAIVFFPVQENILFCGLAGIVTVKRSSQEVKLPDIPALVAMVSKIEGNAFTDCLAGSQFDIDRYLGGQTFIEGFLSSVRQPR